MALSVRQPSLPTPILLPDKSRKQAKATVKSVRKPDVSQWQQWGACIGEVQAFFRLTLKEFAAALGNKDERQVKKWIDAEVRPQIEAVLAVDRFQGVMLIAMAKRTQGVEVDEVVHIRRTR